MKIKSHESLKKELIKDLDMFKKRCYTKQYIIQLCEAYRAKATIKENKEQLYTKLRYLIINSENMPHPDIFSLKYDKDAASLL